MVRKGATTGRKGVLVCLSVVCMDLFKQWTPLNRATFIYL